MCSAKPAVRTGGTFSATDQPCCGLTPCQQAEPTSSQELHFGKFQEPAMPSSWAHHLRPRFPDYSLHHPLSCCSHLPVWGPARSIQLLSASLLPSDSVFQEFWAPIHRPPRLDTSLIPSLESCPSVNTGQRQWLIYNVVKHIF